MKACPSQPRLRIVTTKPFTITGNVGAAAGSPIAGATVTVGGFPGHVRCQWPLHGHDGPGGFDGEYTITAADAGFVSSSVTLMIPNGATITENFVLTPLGSLVGSIRDTSGRPVKAPT